MWTPLLASSSSLEHPIGAPRVFFNSKYLIIAKSLRRTFSKRNSRKKNRSDNEMAAPEASVYPVRNRLRYNFFLYQTNESCSQSVSRRLTLIRRFNKSCLRVTGPNATEAERPFYERSHMVLHVTRRLLLQLLASMLFSHVRF